ncbi:MAG: hypothetical protein IJU12_07190 [Clostridia bacterium]|nr:hypothetical protein [Clostridia bacterium]
MEETLRKILALLEQMNDRRERLLSAFLSGVLRGIGTMIGFAVLGTALVWLLQSIARANLPLISDFLAQVVTMVKLRMQ